MKIVLINTDKLVKNTGIKQITSTNIYQGNSYDPNGLFSERIFGLEGSSEYKENIAYIDLHARVLHPIVFFSLKKRMRLIEDIIFLRQKVKWDNDKKIFVKDKNGDYGLLFLMKHFVKLQESSHKTVVSIVKKFMKFGLESIFVRYIIVNPPFFRPISIVDNVKRIDKINDFYIKLLNASNEIKTISPNDVMQLNVQLAKIQQIIIDFYLYIREKIAKKEGVIRQNILGKRMDFSARAVITPDYEIKLGYVGIPYRMCVNLLMPFIIHRIMKENNEEINKFIEDRYKKVKTFEVLKDFLKEFSNGFINDEKIINYIYNIVDDVAKDKVCLLKRDPALHRTSLQAFFIQPVDGVTIRLHPMYCSSYNADFDGDQMAVYMVFSKEAQQEAKEKMFSIFNPASYIGQNFTLKNEMYLGLYILTKNEENKKPRTPINNVEEAKKLHIYDPVLYIGNIKTTAGRVIFNSALPDKFPFINDVVTKNKMNDIFLELREKYSLQEYIEACDKLMRLGFDYATLYPGTFTIEDLEEDNEIKALRAKFVAEKDVNKAIEIKNKAIKLIEEKMKNKNSSIVDIMESGAGKGFKNLDIVLFSGGFVVGADGKILNKNTNPVKNGFTPVEYFYAGANAVKGIADRAVNTSNTGYLTRQYVYAASPISLSPSLQDCGTKRYLKVKVDSSNSKRLIGRYYKTSSGVDDVITIDNYKNLEGKIIEIRSPMYCKSMKICRKCYGKLYDLHKSEDIGILAGETIGERGTQLIMRTFHVGAVTGVKKFDVIQNILDNNYEINKNELLDYIRYDKDNEELIANKDLLIYIDKELISTGFIMVDDASQIISFGFTQFTIIDPKDKTTQIDIQIDSKFNLRYQESRKREVSDGDKKSYIVVLIKEDEPIGRVLFEVEMMSQQLKKIISFFSPKYKFTDTNVLLQKYIDLYGNAGKNIDYVHFEVILAVALRNKHNQLYQARLIEPYEPQLVSLKTIPYLEGGLLGLQFENFHKAIESSLLFESPRKELTSLEKLSLMGGI